MRFPKVLLFALPCVLACSAAAIDPVPSSASALASVNQGLLTDSGELPPPVGLKGDDLFGSALAISADGTTAIFGSPGRSESGVTRCGAAYVYTRPSGGTWSLQAQLLAADKSAKAELGFAVSLSDSGDVAIVGAPGTVNLGLTDTGASYIFQRSGTAWNQVAKLTGTSAHTGGRYGQGVTISGDGAILAIGAPHEPSSAGVEDAGAAYFYATSPSPHLLTRVLGPNGQKGDLYGTSIALDQAGGWAIVGAVGQSVRGARRGAAYAHGRAGLVFDPGTLLLASDGSDNSGFGAAVALSSDGTVALIGAPLQADAGPASSSFGAAYIFKQSSSLWSQNDKLISPSSEPSQRFGGAVALSGNGKAAMIGTRWQDTPPYKASAAMSGFLRCQSPWTRLILYAYQGPEWVDSFGRSVAVSRNGFTTMVGAPSKDKNAGAVFMIETTWDLGHCCEEASDCASGFCVDGVCCDSTCGGGKDGDCQTCSSEKGAERNGRCGPVELGRECRSAAGSCDRAELCDGKSFTCPADAKLPSGSVCRPAGGRCALDAVCDGRGDGCPPSPLAPKGKLCGAAGACYEPALCSGDSVDCPAILPKPKGTSCGSGPGIDPICDPDDTCDGAGWCDIQRPPDGISCNLSGGGDGVCKLGSCVPRI